MIPVSQPGRPMQAPVVPGIIPPPGVIPPPGMAPQAQQPAAPDPRRNPFAAQAGFVAQAAPQVITDAGPLIEIPQERKSHTKLLIALIITAAIPMVVGWGCGRIYGARILFNKTVDDAGRIREEVTKMTQLNSKLAGTLQESRVRGRGKVLYDEKLIEDLKDILRSSPYASAEKAKRRQDELFRTNYAMMEDIVISRLFNYYNNTLRLLTYIEEFIQKTDRSMELIKSYSDEQASKEAKKYGIVFAEDAGRYFLGQLVEVGNIICSDKDAKDCAKEDIEGFMIRTGLSSTWSPRVGKPEENGKITDIVIPIIPDENWRQVAIGQRGYLAYKEYAIQFGRLAAIVALLSRDERVLLQDLGKAAGREKLFAPL